LALFKRDPSLGLQTQLKRLEASHNAATAARDGVRLEHNRQATWALMLTAGKQLNGRHAALPSLFASSGSLRSRRVTSRLQAQQPLAAALLGAAKLSLTYETAAENWQRAAVAGYLLSLAVATLAASGLDTMMLGQVAAFLERTPDRAAYAAHRAGLPQMAVVILEAVSSLVLDTRMMSRSLEAYVEASSARPDLERLLGRLRLDLDRPSAPLAPAPQGPSGTDAGVWSQLGPQIDAAMAEDFARVASEGAGPGRHGLVSSYLLTSAPTQALLAAANSQRTLVYILAADHGGAALKVSPTAQPPIISVELPDLSVSTVDALLGRIQALSHDRQLRTRRRRVAHVDAVLGDLGAVIWAPLLDAWPALLHEPIAVVPVGEIALLPLFTAQADTVPVCARIDLTLIPSARALFLAGQLQPSATDRVLVAADPSLASNPIPQTIDEVRSVANLYGTKAQVFDATSQASPQRWAPMTTDTAELAEQLGSASLIHLACHGQLSADDPMDSVLLLGSGIRLRQLLERSLLAGALVVLSACELGSIGRDHPNEQLGFPAAVLATGARSMVGALWSVPDDAQTTRFMVDFHQHLQTQPSPTALGLAIKAAHQLGVPSTVWAPFTHLGAESQPRRQPGAGTDR
jgi:CHAT domain-containing protein